MNEERAGWFYMIVCMVLIFAVYAIITHLKGEPAYPYLFTVVCMMLLTIRWEIHLIKKKLKD